MVHTLGAQLLKSYTPHKSHAPCTLNFEHWFVLYVSKTTILWIKNMFALYIYNILSTHLYHIVKIYAVNFICIRQNEWVVLFTCPSDRTQPNWLVSKPRRDKPRYNLVITDSSPSASDPSHR